MCTLLCTSSIFWQRWLNYEITFVNFDSLIYVDFVCRNNSETEAKREKHPKHRISFFFFSWFMTLDCNPHSTCCRHFNKHFKSIKNKYTNLTFIWCSLNSHRELKEKPRKKWWKSYSLKKAFCLSFYFCWTLFDLK